jgi:hypothetical protein
MDSRFRGNDTLRRVVFYLDLFRVLDEKCVHYFLIGGLAMNLHGVPRTTMDVDM